MSILTEEFVTGQVLEAADVTNSALQSWIRRGLIVGHRGQSIDMPGSPGIRRKFSFFNVIEIALAKALIDVGVELAAAFQAASDFAHSGDENRLPGLPFTGERHTLLCVAGQRSTVFAWTPGQDPTADIQNELGWPLGWSTVDVGEVFNRVAVALGHHPQAVIDEEYGEG
ncbi:MerR family transcriptional regulator [Xanthobacter autotrophicus]|uniref:hypothetical protein n=1 Tax=Xanthobacter autotrophicus TaxID=280 RepID=UPI003726E277